MGATVPIAAVNPVLNISNYLNNKNTDGRDRILCAADTEDCTHFLKRPPNKRVRSYFEKLLKNKRLFIIWSHIITCLNDSVTKELRSGSKFVM